MSAEVSVQLPEFGFPAVLEFPCSNFGHVSPLPKQVREKWEADTEATNKTVKLSDIEARLEAAESKRQVEPRLLKTFSFCRGPHAACFMYHTC